ncbi:TerC family protein [Nannocystis sp.]|uniref:TerC family protein n=1 Tax=Nannocystis sp. TaxID=1962667 RepID=UPI00242505EC|nr:TerC family protein [Nannocystis sp.]MBK7827808.1 TerC family protein [Nannocystis sp.]MBK9753848.1 TerC family protein [Nannocystis sp.]
MFHTVGSPLSWGLFLLGFFVILALDLGVFNRKPHRVTMGEALRWSVVWVALSLAFNAYVYYAYGQEKALEFMSAYFIEEALSVDNIFVFVVLFRYMRIPAEYLHRVLFAGILGALILRGVFIGAGLALIEMFTWSLYLFGGFLLLTGLRLLFVSGDEGEPSGGQKDNWVKRMVEKYLRVTKEFDGPHFFTLREGRRYATPLFVTLLMVETADVVFALDSIPAIFGITTDPFIVFTSNMCAVMGLRSMFFLLENVIDRFHLLKYGLGLVLSFVGTKMILGMGLGSYLAPYHIPVKVSLAVVAGLILSSVLLSLLFPPRATHDKPKP